MNNDEILDVDFNEQEGIKFELLTAEKFLLLFILTLGLYGIWWMYKSWRFFKEKDNLDAWPAMRALFAIFFLHGLLERILNFAKRNGYTKTYSSSGLFVLFIFLNFLGRLPDPFWLFSVIAGTALIQPIRAFNFAIEHSEVYHGIYPNTFNHRQIGLIIIGGIWWVLILIGLFMPGDF